MVLAADRMTPAKEIDLKSYPCAVDIIYKGGIVAINSAGYAAPASDSATDLMIVGVADETVDNSAGAAGDKLVRVRSGRAFKLAASSITQAMVGTMMFVVDDQTVDDGAGTTNDVPVGILVEYISSTEGWVFIPQGGRFTVSGIVNADIAAGAAIARSKLAEDALQVYGVPLLAFHGDDGAPLTVAETAGTFNIGLGTNTLVVQGEITDNETEVSVGYFEFTLPPEYVAAGDVRVRLRSAIIKTGAAVDNGSTLDVEAYEQADGAVGADLCATAAASFAAVDTWYNKDFVITAAGLVAGDRIIVKVTSSIIDSEAGGGTLRINIEPKMLVDVKG